MRTSDYLFWIFSSLEKMADFFFFFSLFESEVGAAAGCKRVSPRVLNHQLIIHSARIESSIENLRTIRVLEALKQEEERRYNRFEQSCVFQHESKTGSWLLLVSSLLVFCMIYCALS